MSSLDFINDRKIEELRARDSPGLITMSNKEKSLLSISPPICTHLIILYFCVTKHINLYTMSDVIKQRRPISPFCGAHLSG